MAERVTGLPTSAAPGAVNVVTVATASGMGSDTVTVRALEVDGPKPAPPE
ncbi:hypothetical protein GS930_20815 [Rhodococcus hoagii]|nr:hypothetical protein [Prescottella equi]